MRLSVFIPQLTPQLLIDLKKLYQGHLSDVELSDKSLVDNLIENKNLQFFVTKFNDRHLGAVKVALQENNAVLSGLCIREVTRRRGIAKNLLKEVEKHLVTQKAQNVTMALSEFCEEEKQGVTAFMLASNYQLENNLFIKQL